VSGGVDNDGSSAFLFLLTSMSDITVDSAARDYVMALGYLFF
jgi:hypothetical protein